MWFLCHMENQIIIVKTNELVSLLEGSISKAFSQAPLKKAEEQLLKRKEVAKLFSVSLVTINTWMRTGKIPYHRINSRVFFKRSELFDALENPSNVKRRLK